MKNDSILGMDLGNFVDIKLRFIFQYLLLSNIETKARKANQMKMVLQMGADEMQKILLYGDGAGVFLHATMGYRM